MSKTTGRGLVAGAAAVGVPSWVTYLDRATGGRRETARPATSAKAFALGWSCGGRTSFGPSALATAAVLARRERRPLLVSAGLGAAGAAAGSLVGNLWRRLATRTVPDWQAAI